MGRIVFHDTEKGLVYIKISKSVFVISEEEFDVFLNMQTTIHKPIDKWNNREMREAIEQVMMKKFVLGS